MEAAFICGSRFLPACVLRRRGVGADPPLRPWALSRRRPPAGPLGSCSLPSLSGGRSSFLSGYPPSRPRPPAPSHASASVLRPLPHPFPPSIRVSLAHSLSLSSTPLPLRPHGTAGLRARPCCSTLLFVGPSHLDPDAFPCARSASLTVGELGSSVEAAKATAM